MTEMKWTREPLDYRIEPDRIEITTTPHTDLWQRTYYHFRNDNAPVLQYETEEKYFSFTVKTDFTESHHRFDQCGIVMYLNAENVPIQPQGGRLLYRVFPGRRKLYPDARMPYVGRCWKDQFRHLRLQSGELQLQSHIHRDEDHRMCLESS